MLSFLPNPYPDELLYSTLARYHIRSGNTSSKITLQELYNDTKTIATTDLPSNIDALIKQLPPLSSHTANNLINNHTLYPFYASFLPQQRAIMIQKSMKGQYGGHIHAFTGISASSIPTPQFFRFCSDCLKQDEQEYGEIYWHRIHQTPGVLVCPYHGTPLHNSTVNYQGLNQHKYEAASLENCRENASVPNYSVKALKILCQISQDIAWLFNHQQLPQPLDWYRQRYLNLLIDKKLATASKRVYQKQLIDEFIFFFGQEVLENLSSMIDNKDDHNWLSSIVRKNRKSFHPIRHLLMMIFLKGSAKAFFEEHHSYKPFGKSPWLCFNGAVDHYLQPVVTNLKVSHCIDNKKPLGTFSCSCGMVYNRTASPNNQDSNYRIGKVITYGAIWERRLQELVEVEKIGLRATARELKVDPRTIKNYVDKLYLNPSWTSRQNQQKSVTIKNTESLKNQKRQQWLNLQKDYPTATKTTLRNLDPAIYSWLYRNDKEWLNENSPALQQPMGMQNRVNWLQRDIQIKKRVQSVVTELLNLEVPNRVTLRKIGIMTGLKAMLEKNLDKLPLTQTYLSEVVESVEMFQNRRIRWAIKEIHQRGEEVKTWKVMRLAGLKEKEFQRVESIVLKIT